jgi:DNA mismatch repair protein MutS
LAEAEIIERVIEVEKPSPALDLLRSIDVDNLTPRQALEQLYALKEQLNS